MYESFITKKPKYVKVEKLKVDSPGTIFPHQLRLIDIIMANFDIPTYEES